MGKVILATLVTLSCLVAADIGLRLKQPDYLDIVVDQKTIRSIAVGNGATAEPGGIAIGHGVYAHKGELVVRVSGFRFDDDSVETHGSAFLF